MDQGLDSEGKALEGAPGAGHYSPYGGMQRRSNVSKTAPSAPFGVRPKKAFYAGKGFDKGAGMEASAGPKYNPNYNAIYSSVQGPSFTKADRDKEKGRYISEVHSTDSAGKDSPGPALYTKHSDVMRGANPAHSFPKEIREADMADRSKFDLPNPTSYRPTAPEETSKKGFSFSPFGERSWGSKRDRYKDMYATYISDEFTRARGNLQTPGPGSYHSERDAVSADRSHSVFGTSGRESQTYQGSGMQPPGTCSPGPIYEQLPPTEEVPTYDFGTSPRFYEPELGSSFSGPHISRLHSNASLAGSNSPGPLAYYPKEAEWGKGVRLEPRRREGTGKGENTETANPVGPGTYKPKFISSEASPRWSIASGFRGDFFTVPASHLPPGPGKYETEDGEAASSPRSSTSKFGSSKRWENVLRANVIPGPGAYTVSGRPATSTGCVIGGRNRGAVKQYLGAALAGNTEAADSPGPAYSVEAERVRKSVRFGSSKQDPLFKSKSESGPGPGAYSVQGFSKLSSHKFDGTMSFGSSSRRPPATVKL